MTYWLLYLFVPIVAVFWTNKVDYIGHEDQNLTTSTLSSSSTSIPVNAQNIAINQQNINSAINIDSSVPKSTIEVPILQADQKQPIQQQTVTNEDSIIVSDKS